MQKLDTIAQEVFGEFGFATCTSDQQEILLTNYLNFKKLCNLQTLNSKN